MVCNAQVKRGCTKANTLCGIVVRATSLRFLADSLLTNFIILWAFTELHQQSMTVVPAYRKTRFQALFMFSFLENYCHLLSQ